MALPDPSEDHIAVSKGVESKTPKESTTASRGQRLGAGEETGAGERAQYEQLRVLPRAGSVSVQR